MFGVGAGSILVPLFILLYSYNERLATGTSLVAIVAIAIFAAITQGLYGNVRVGDAALVGLPAIAGVVVGTWLQQRVPTKVISLLFACLMVAVGLELIIK